jgi:hypothetical protein
LRDVRKHGHLEQDVPRKKKLSGGAADAKTVTHGLIFCSDTFGLRQAKEEGSWVRLAKIAA